MNVADRRLILKELITAWGYYLQPYMTFADGRLLLAAIAETESTFGFDPSFRYEPAYDTGGRYFEKNYDYNFPRYGKAACGSRSSFQILYPTCLELGMPKSTPPVELENDSFAIIWVCKYIIERAMKKGAKSVEDFADIYNSGSLKGVPPEKYVANFSNNYKIVAQLRSV